MESLSEDGIEFVEARIVRSGKWEGVIGVGFGLGIVEGVGQLFMYNRGGVPSTGEG